MLAADLQRYRVPARVQRVIKHQFHLCAADGSSCTDQADSLAALLRGPCVPQHAKEGGAAAWNAASRVLLQRHAASWAAARQVQQQQEAAPQEVAAAGWLELLLGAFLTLLLGLARRFLRCTCRFPAVLFDGCAGRPGRACSLCALPDGSLLACDTGVTAHGSCLRCRVPRKLPSICALHHLNLELCAPFPNAGGTPDDAGTRSGSQRPPNGNYPASGPAGCAPTPQLGQGWQCRRSVHRREHSRLRTPPCGWAVSGTAGPAIDLHRSALAAFLPGDAKRVKSALLFIQRSGR